SSSETASFNSLIELASSFAFATSARCRRAEPALLRLPAMTPSMTDAAAALAPPWSVSDESHCLVAAALACASPGVSMKGGSIPAASLATAKHVRAISRSPPSAARPACMASARKRHTGVATAYGGNCPIKLILLRSSVEGENLGVPRVPGYIEASMAQPPKSILWVDDEGELLESHRIFLRSKGYEVEWGGKADDAVEMLRRRPFDIMLLDEHIPGKLNPKTNPNKKNPPPNHPIVKITKSEKDA